MGLNRKILQTRKEETSDLKKLAMFYGQLRIIGIHYRLILSQFPIICAMCSFIAIQMACLYNSFSFISGKDTGGPVWYDLLYAWSEITSFTTVIFLFSILGDVYNVSQRVQQQINGRHDLKKNKWFKRWLKSCPVFKIYFGGSNYLDRLTPLNIQNFAFNQTVSLMLLQN